MEGEITAKAVLSPYSILRVTHSPLHRAPTALILPRYLIEGREGSLGLPQCLRTNSKKAGKALLQDLHLHPQHS